MLRNAVESRGIEYVVHFTRLANLNSILAHGLVPRSILEANNLPFTFNDELRIDGYENASCCSIGYPNYKMFYRARCENPGVEWVVLGINKKILWEKNVAFCVNNAASAEILRTPLTSLQGINAFSNLFNDYGDKRRVTLNLPDNYPTNPQAEVLVFDTIEPENFIGVIFESEIRKAQYAQQYSNLELLGNKALFGPRPDHQHWH